MSLILDIILALLFFIIVIISAKRGFVKSVWGGVTVIGAFVLAFLFGPVLGDWIYETVMLGRVTDYVFDVIKRLVVENSGQYDVSSLFTTLPEDFTRLLENCGADIAELQESFELGFSMSESELYSFAGAIAEPLARTVSMAAGILGAFAIAVILLWIVGLLFKAIVQLPLISSLDGLLGFVLGLVKGAVIIWVVCMALNLLSMQGFMNPAYADILAGFTEGSFILNLFARFP
ncbi:MAG: CvpA family protein [Eubacteriales bacterium]